MGTIPEKLTENGELHNYPFDAEIFREDVQWVCSES